MKDMKEKLRQMNKDQAPPMLSQNSGEAAGPFFPSLMI